VDGRDVGTEQHGQPAQGEGGAGDKQDAHQDLFGFHGGLRRMDARVQRATKAAGGRPCRVLPAICRGWMSAPSITASPPATRAVQATNRTHIRTYSVFMAWLRG